MAERIIARVDQQHPADALLRAELRETRLPPHVSREVASTVFAYFRWLGWLTDGRPLSARVREALDLAKRFATSPDSFGDSEMQARAVPEWLHGQMRVSAAYARSLLAEPRLWLRARPSQGSALAAALGQCRTFGKGRLADALLYTGEKDLFRVPEFSAGRFELQDLSSQAVGLICNPHPGETWWDACAGEGGKTLHLSDLMENKGLIWASDAAEWRLRQLRRRAARARVFNFRTANWTGGLPLPTKTRFDGVLVDAPCSGIGTWQRNPHARWTTTPNDVAELAALQLRLLCNAATGLPKGGVLFYTVCTLSRPETTGVARAFEAVYPGFRRLETLNPLRAAGEPTAETWIWPQEFGSNGMFVCGWRRERA